MKKVLIAGASGFIGRALIDHLLSTTDHSIVALSRVERKSSNPRLEWRKCDMFSLKDITNSMEGCDQAYYLVHSMLPSASLSQGTFYDFDLIIADNFVRAGHKHKLKHIIYLGGMIPTFESLSWHLRSRLEVEQTLRNSGIKTTALRASLIVGADGSSFSILQRLVERLPVMICPAWTKTKTQPIALGDVLKILTRSLQDESIQGKIYDIAGREIVTYQDLIAMAAQEIRKNRRLFTLPIIPLGLSRFWITLVTGIPKNLVYPLVLSLKHEMLAEPQMAWPFPEDTVTPLKETLILALRNHKEVSHKGYVPEQKDVRSVQRLVLPLGRDADWVANEYFNWLPTFFSTLVKVTVKDNVCTFYLFYPSIVILVLEKNIARSSPDRPLLYVVGGLLSAKQDRGRLEFREVLEKKYVIAALHEFRPALPWYVYKYSQALVHLIVMRAFGEHLKWVVISDTGVNS
jgi:uncharacterized protein YbjT (DUF2867 family)